METPLKTERVRRGLTQAAVANAVGVNQGHYSRLENGETVVMPDMARKLARHFGYAITEHQILYPGDYQTEAKAS